MIAKNERGYKVVLRSGVSQLAHNLGNQMLLNRLHECERDNNKNVNAPSKNVVASKLLDQLREENEFLQGQLTLRERDNSHIQELPGQQRQLTLRANRQVRKLQEKLQLTYTEEAPESGSMTLSEATETTDKQIDTEKK